MTLKCLFYLLVLLIVLGCDISRGVTRVAILEPIPPSECVLRTANDISGITEVTYSIEKGGRPLTLTGIKKADVIHRYWYVYKGVKNYFDFLESYNGRVEFRHGYGCMGCSPPQHEIDTVYPFIISLEKDLETKCDLQGLTSNVKEYCGGVKCPE